MGLDIYLYTRQQAEQNAAYDVASEALYTEGPDGKTPRDKMSSEEYAAWGEQYSYALSETVASVQHPDHLFNRRYLRISYNGGGFNHAVPQMLKSSGEKEYPNERGSLYWIFEPMGREWDGDAGVLTADDLPKLQECRDRAQSVVEELSGSDRLRVTTVAGNIFSGPPTATDDDAIHTYRQVVARGPSLEPESWYSTQGIEVYGTGMTLLAAVPGKDTFGKPAVHLIYKAGDDGFTSYLQSAEIVVEFCDEAVSLIERDGGCSMSWSG